MSQTSSLAASLAASLPLSVRLGLRELRGGLRGFVIFLLCIVLGVAAIGSVGSVREAVLTGISEHGQTILGADIDLRMTNYPIEDSTRSVLEERYVMARTVNLRAMAENATGKAGDDGLPPRSLVELKGVELKGGERGYPLYGAVQLESETALERQLARRNGLWGAVVDPVVLDKLRLGVGDEIRLGEAMFEIRDTIVREPDRTADGFTLAPRVMVAHSALPATGLIRLGSLIRYHYKLALGPSQPLEAEKDWLQQRFPEAGWRLRDNQSGAAGTERFLGRLSVFLTLAGLTALVVGGVGIANAISGYVNAKRDAIATFKSMGASGPQVFWAYLTQTVVLGAMGVGIGLVLAAVVPFLALQLLADVLPVPAEAGIYPGSLVLAAGYGILTILAFSIWPLGRARDVPAAGLFRQIVAPISGRPRWRYIGGAVLALLFLVVLALAFAGNWIFTSWFLLGAAASFAVLYGAGWSIMRLSAHLPRPRLAFLRTALANLHRPGAPTPSVVLSLGLGLTLLVVIAQIEANLSAQIDENLPDDAPAFFFVDVQTDEVDAFEDKLQGLEGVTRIQRAPMLRATITRIDGTPVQQAEVAPEAQWAVRGDRGLTYAETPPEGTTIVAGDWWAKDYSGPPRISFDADIARGMGIGVGDTLTFNVMGRAITAEIGNLRRIDWQTFGMNFTVIFAPGTLEAAPHAHLVVLSAEPGAERRIERVMAREFPNVTAVRVRDVLQTVNSVLGDIGMAIRGASAAALLAGIVVLAGAMAAGYRQRVRDAVILKVLGATRLNVASIYLLEYAILGFITALVAMAIGTVAAWLVVSEVMESEWVWRPGILAGTALGGMLITVVFGFFGTWRSLNGKPARILRAE